MTDPKKPTVKITPEEAKRLGGLAEMMDKLKKDIIAAHLKHDPDSSKLRVMVFMEEREPDTESGGALYGFYTNSCMLCMVDSAHEFLVAAGIKHDSEMGDEETEEEIAFNQLKQDITGKKVH